jgi:hypothetical protein
MFCRWLDIYSCDRFERLTRIEGAIKSASLGMHFAFGYKVGFRIAPKGIHWKQARHLHVSVSDVLSRVLSLTC